MFPDDIFLHLVPFKQVLQASDSSYNAVHIYYTTRGVKQKDNTQQGLQTRI